MPVTLTGGALYTHRLQTEEPGASPIAAAFHGVLYPSLKLGPHWFVYSSIHLRSTPFSYYDAYESEHEFKAQVVQAFLGYTRTLKKATVLVKVAQLSSASGSFPLPYEDAGHHLLDQA